jgi:phage terminase small subunit
MPRTPLNPASLKRLTSRQQRFVEEYLVDLNATRAACRAGYSARSAYALGPELLQYPHVREAVQKARAEQQERTRIDADRILLEIARLALYDPRKFFDAEGSPLRITDLDADTAAALNGIEVVEQYTGRGAERQFVGFVKKYKLVDKGPNLDRLMKHLGLYSADNRQRTDPLETLLQAIAGGNSSVLRPVPQDPERPDPTGEDPPEEEEGESVAGEDDEEEQGGEGSVL